MPVYSSYLDPKLYRQAAGNVIDTLSTPFKKFGLPDFGISERIAGGPTTNTNTRLAPQGYASDAFSSSSQQNASYGTPASGVGGNYLGQPNTSSNSLPQGGGNSAPTGPGSGLNLEQMYNVNGEWKTGRTILDETGGTGLYQSAPQAPQIDFDALIAPALQALDAAIAPNESAYQANLSQIDTGKNQAVQGQQSALAEAQAAAEQARQRASGQGEDAVNEQRRMFAEQQQGLQARYGGTTGTGRFISELAGSQVGKNIAGLRTNLSNVLQNIDTSLEKVRTVSQVAIQDAEDKARDLKLQAKTQLDQALSNIRLARGELLGRKQELATQAVQWYQDRLAQVEAANTQFRQQVFLQAQNAEQQLASARQRGSDAVKQFQSVNFGTNPSTGMNVLGAFNPYTGQYSNVQEGGGQLTGFTQNQDNFIDDPYNQ